LRTQPNGGADGGNVLGFGDLADPCDAGESLFRSLEKQKKVDVNTLTPQALRYRELHAQTSVDA
jgi:hypothetical protein